MEETLKELLIGGARELGVSLDDEAVDHFSKYLDLLQLWGARMNLTTRLEGKEVVVYHFLDSLAGVPWLRGNPRARVVDLGSGAGFPGLPLKIALPGLQILLLDGSQKKTSFCREVVRVTGLTGIEALWGRAETIGTSREHAGRYDWAISRAVAKAGELLKLGLPFLASGGGLLLYKGEPSREEISGLERACKKSNAGFEEHRIAVPFLKGARTLFVIRRCGGEGKRGQGAMFHVEQGARD